MKLPVIRFTCSLAFIVAIGLSARAENWPSWRGPTANGAAAGQEYPTKWSATENVKWKIPLPGLGASTPIVWEQTIFLTCGIEGRNTVIALDRSGKELWRTPIGEENPGKHKKATGSNPSAVTDGEHVFVYFKSGDLACLDFDGKVIWHENLQQKYGEDTLWWDLGTSPVLTKNAVVVAVMHSGPSYLAAFEKASGKVAWKQDRNLDAPEEAAQSYSTPVVLEHDGNEILVCLGADHVTCHEAATGKEMWRVGGLNPTNHKYFRSIASAVVDSNVVIAPYARGATVTAIKLGGSGDVTDTHVLWTQEGLGADVPTPAAKDGKAYICTDKGELACVDIPTGNVVWRVKAEPNRNAYSSSPILAGDKVYLTREDGKVFVIDIATKQTIAANEISGEFTVATPVFVDGTVLLRTHENLYCIGE